LDQEAPGDGFFKVFASRLVFFQSRNAVHRLMNASSHWSLLRFRVELSRIWSRSCILFAMGNRAGGFFGGFSKTAFHQFHINE
jgi:hypothetical protein